MNDKKKMFALLLVAVYGILFVYGKANESIETGTMSKVHNRYSEVSSSMISEAQETRPTQDKEVMYGGTLSDRYNVDISGYLMEGRVQCDSQEEFTNILRQELIKKTENIEIFYAGEENLKPFLEIDAKEYGIDSASCSYIHMDKMTGVVFNITYEILQWIA